MVGLPRTTCLKKTSCLPEVNSCQSFGWKFVPSFMQDLSWFVQALCLMLQSLWVPLCSYLTVSKIQFSCSHVLWLLLFLPWLLSLGESVRTWTVAFYDMNTLFLVQPLMIMSWDSSRHRLKGVNQSLDRDQDNVVHIILVEFLKSLPAFSGWWWSRRRQWIERNFVNMIRKWKISVFPLPEKNRSTSSSVIAT